MTRTARAPAALARTSLRIDQRSQIIKSVGRDDASRNEFPESNLDFSPQLTRAANNIREKRRASLLEKLEDVRGYWTETARFFDI